MKLKNKIYFVAGSSTDVGKTFLIEKICEKFREKKVSFDVVKPIISGFSVADSNSDSARILKALGYDLTIKNFDEISPWRFEMPISPNIAANRENKKIDFAEVVSFCNKKIAESIKNNKFLFIESAGGIMSPINDNKTFLDLAISLKIPVLFITANYLGAISHTLCSLEVMKAKNIIPEIMIINNHLSENNLANLEEVRNTISNFGKIKTLSLDVFLD
jgi:dethiobiotin synthetase